MKNNMGNQVALSAEQSREGEASTAALQVLIDARKLIENESDWGGANKSGCHCPQTAITCKAGYAHEEPALNAFMMAAGIEPGPYPYRDIWNWNDARERTHTEVLAAFDKAIEAERAKSPKVNHG